MYNIKYSLGQKVYYFNKAFFEIESFDVLSINLKDIDNNIIIYYCKYDEDIGSISYPENELFGSKQACRDFYINKIKDA
jgi:hypothetical protein